MKYKNIISAIHNFGHSFLSNENYVDEDFVIDELRNIHRKGYDISVNWITREFEPSQLLSERIKKSIGYWPALVDAAVLALTKPCLALCRDKIACCSSFLIATNRMFGRVTASQIASASAASVLFALT
jgi:hypothetical protein